MLVGLLVSSYVGAPHLHPLEVCILAASFRLCSVEDAVNAVFCFLYLGCVHLTMQRPGSSPFWKKSVLVLRTHCFLFYSFVFVLGATDFGENGVM